MLSYQMRRQTRDTPSRDGHGLPLRSSQIQANKDPVQPGDRRRMRQSLVVALDLSKGREGRKEVDSRRGEYRVFVNDAQVLGGKIRRGKDNQNQILTETRASPSGGIKKLDNAREQVLTPPEDVSQKWEIGTGVQD